MVRQVVDELGGQIEVSTKVGQGTTFRVRFRLGSDEDMSIDDTPLAEFDPSVSLSGGRHKYRQ